MIIWLNGAFGAGKTTVAGELCRRLPAARLFDPERVGAVLRRVRPVPTGDYQDLPAWRRWTVRLTWLAARGGRPVVVPMTVWRPDHRAALLGGLRERGLAVRQVVLRVPPSVLRDRIDADRVEAAARDWRHAHLDRTVAGLAGCEPGTIEVTHHGRAPGEVAAEIVARLDLNRPTSKRRS
ncbi:AAA family ATPase [Micromonospora echinofusca]|uniref:AAA family ATPase n=1 Tax=Micromonospora echinofusca TaxID=47858 RepID=A0ABS3VPB6_MICEH|nr:ATP-binding protein [Micromonospora echinofusca]MBO4206347.1 AAA family ATPase [Micromonospora echinofusca]